MYCVKNKRAGIKRAVLFLMLAALLALSLGGCRQSPTLEKTIYAERVKPQEPEQKQEAPPQVKPEPPAEKPEPPQVQQDLTLDNEGDAEASVKLIDDSEAGQIVTEGGVVIEVPESRPLVTTVSEATQNPHWKSSIDFASDRYSGERIDGIFQGTGSYTWEDGESYEGEWAGGMFSGLGTYTWMNGDRYEGEWRTETFEGKGTYTWASGSSYAGEWKAGVKEGTGTYVWANGDRYEGQWKAGVKEGVGTYIWADGSIYEGEWQYGIKEGQGTYRGVDGTVFQGLWKNDKFVQGE